MENVEDLDNDTHISLKLFVVLSRTLQTIEKMTIKEINNQGLNLTEFGVLELLYHKGDQPIQKIGQKILLASSSITYVVDKLEEKNENEDYIIKARLHEKDEQIKELIKKQEKFEQMIQRLIDSGQFKAVET